MTRSALARALAALAALSFAAAACGGGGGASRPVGGGDQASAGASAPVSGAGSSPSGSAPGSPAPGGTDVPGSGEPSPRGTTTIPARTWENTMPLTLTLNRTCARRGDAIEATVETEPNSALGMTSSYSDNDFTPDVSYVPKEAMATGTYTWRFVLRPGTPMGRAVVTALAAKDDRGGMDEKTFTVASSC